MEFSVYLKELIKKRGYSFRKLGRVSGVNHTYISKICRGSSGIPSPEILKKLSTPLYIPYEDLLGAAGYLLAEKKSKYPTEFEEEILPRMTRLTPEGKKRLLEFMDFLEDWEKKKARGEKKYRQK
ncbi:MAG: helix-turn-helix domain-containing protein [Bacillota bacterium]